MGDLTPPPKENKRLACRVSGKSKKTNMKKLTTVQLRATTGKETIADSNLFSYIDSDFKNWGLNIPDKETKAMNLDIVELTKDATFGQMFKNPEKQTMTQGQILEFVKNHKENLCQNWYTFFLFKVGNKFFVAFVSLGDDGGLEVHVREFSYDYVWGGERRRRLVMPSHWKNAKQRKSDMGILEKKKTKHEND